MPRVARSPVERCRQLTADVLELDEELEVLVQRRAPTSVGTPSPARVQWMPSSDRQRSPRVPGVSPAIAW